MAFYCLAGSRPFLFFSFLPSPFFFVPFLCLKEAERETERKQKGCLPFEVLSDASRDDLHAPRAFAFLSDSPAPQPLQDSRWGLVLDGAGLERGVRKRMKGVALGRRASPACPGTHTLDGCSPFGS